MTAYATAAAAVSTIDARPLMKSAITNTGRPSSHFASHVAPATSFSLNFCRPDECRRPM